MKMVENGKKKTNQKKKSKARQMWIERFFYETDDLKKRVSALEETVRFISDEIQKLQSDKNV